MFRGPSNRVPRPRADRTADRAAVAKRRHRDGTPGAEAREMATRTKRPSEAWTIPLHVIMWTVMTVGFIMALVVLMMR
jgi:hypothetical protein